jgi:glycosyltransferase involved in cell wall biosynthesis
MTRVALLSLHHDPAWTSPAAFIAGDFTRRGYARSLADRGLDVRVVVEAEFDADAVDTHGSGVPWHFRRADPAIRVARQLGRACGDRWPALRTPAPHVERVLRADPPDIVHSFDLVAYPHLLALGRLGVPLLAHFHGGAAARRSVWRALEKRALSKVKRLLFTTSSHAAGWIANGYPEDQVRVVFETSVDLQPVTRRPNVDPVLVCVGRLDAVKDPLTTLAGFEQLLVTHPNAVLHLCWTDAPMREAVQAYARRLGERVRLHGTLRHEAVIALMRSADVLVQSSVREVCGVAVLEAMALGVPPVVTDIPAFRAVLGDCGARFPVGDAAGLADGVRRVLGDPDAARACRDRFERHLSFDALAEQLCAVYADLLGVDPLLLV